MSSVSMYGSPVSGPFLGTCAPVYQTTSIVPAFLLAVWASRRQVFNHQCSRPNRIPLRAFLPSTTICVTD
jgi:hypothetical protein